MRNNLSLVTLGVKDFKRALKFYRDGLGWKAKVMDEIAFFELNGVILAIWSRANLAKDAKLPVKGSGFRGIALAHNTRSRKEVDAVIAQAKRAGAKILKKPQKVFWGGYSGYFADPDGHIWEVAHNPFWKLDAKGRVRL